MSTEIHCPKCKGIFNSTESYENHLPCHDSRTLGGSGDTYLGKSDESSGGIGGQD